MSRQDLNRPEPNRPSKKASSVRSTKKSGFKFNVTPMDVIGTGCFGPIFPVAKSMYNSIRGNNRVKPKTKQSEQAAHTAQAQAEKGEPARIPDGVEFVNRRRLGAKCPSDFRIMWDLLDQCYAAGYCDDE